MTGDAKQVSRWGRFWAHLTHGPAAVRRVLPTDAMDRLEARIGAAEGGHAGEIRVCVEASLPALRAWHGHGTRERAWQLFSDLRVWDTAANSGVLVYLLLADRAIEIVADRGLAGIDWEPVMSPLRAALRDGAFERGLADAVDAVAREMRRRFPLDAEGQARDVDELPNRPHVV